MTMTRRSALAAATALPFAGALGISARPASAQGEGPMPAARGFTLGDMEVATLLAGTRTSTDDPQGTFGMNVPPERFAEVSRENFIPADRSQFFFIPTIVRSGGEVVLFDTGLSAAGTAAALQSAGFAPEDVTIVALTHMHGDHIGGMTQDDGSPAYPNARYVAGQVEYDAWDAMNDETFQAKVKPFAEQMTFVQDGDDVVPGITAMAAFGHTPGHMTYMLDSGDRQMLLMADTANHYVWSLAHPEWEVRFDMDKSAAAETRKRVLGMLAADRIPLVGYHMPFPGSGYVEARGEGFRYVPTSYQLML